MKLATPLDMLFYRERTTPRRNFLFQPHKKKWRSYAWEEVGQEVRTMATYLKKRNFPAGSRIAIFSRNCAHWLMADWAIWLAGHVSVPLFPNLTSKSVNQILTHSDARLVFIGEVADWQDARQGIPPETELIAFPDIGPPKLPKWSDVKKSSLPMSSARVPALDDLATIIYTSGTTGDPKGVMHTFRSISYAGSKAVKETGISPSDRMFSYLPLSHVAERLLTETNTLYSGSSLYFCEGLDSFVRDLKVARPTVFLGVPRIWQKIREQVDQKLGAERVAAWSKIPLLGLAFAYFVRMRLGLHCTRLFLTGAAPISKEVQSWFQNLGMSLQEAYGMTENFAFSHFTRPKEVRIGWVGTPFEGVEVKHAEDGEVLMRSPSVMEGYFKAEELTKEILTEDGWLRTGDLGEIDADTGALRITGRKKDLFKTSKGKFVAPVPIEDKLASTNYFEQICVLGTGQPQPVAVVRLQACHREKSPMALRRDLAKVRETINSDLDRHEQIGKIAVIDEEWTVENGVLTPTLKIKRNVLESRFQQALDAWNEGGEDIVFADTEKNRAAK